MKRRSMIALGLSICMFSSTAIGCGSSTKQESESKPVAATETETAESGYGAGEWRKYEEPINLTFGYFQDINGSDNSAMAAIGEPYNDNRWIRYYKEECGINVEYTLMAPNTTDYQQQLMLAMTSGELPDIFPVTDLTVYKQLVEAGVIADLTDIFETEANPTFKGLETDLSEDFLDNYKIDGKLYCMPARMPSTNGYSYLWIRKDWLDNLGLEIPKTMDDVKAVAKAFTEQDPDGNGKDDTMGLSIDQFYSTFGQEGIFWAFGGKSAGKKQWNELEDGTVGYSMVQPEMKGGLQFLNELYEAGYLNPEFTTQTWTDIGGMIASNSLGMFYGCHWYSHQMNAVKDEIPEAEWIPILAPGTDGNPAPVYASLDYNCIYCVNANCENPEALIAMMNAYSEKLFGENNDFDNYFACAESGNVWKLGPVWILSEDVDLMPYRQMKEAKDAGTLDELDGVGGSYWKIIEEGNLAYDLMFGPEGSCFELVNETYPDIVTWNAYQGIPTETQGERWNSLQEIIDTSYIQMIKGEVDIDEGFDAMVKQWNDAGGAAVTQEVNEMIANR